MQKIHVDLVPKSCFFTNVRSQVSNEDWDWLRREAYKQACHQCEVCSARGRMEAHEIWHYDDKKLIQKLVGITCVCNLCHEIYHLGFAELNGHLPRAKKRLSKVNCWSKEETDLYVEAVFEIWHQRSQKKWNLDLSLLDKCNISYSLTTPFERKKIADKKIK